MIRPERATNVLPGRQRDSRGRCSPWALFALLLFAFSSPSSALALPFTPAISQLSHASWRVQDGVIPGSAYDVEQTPDGYVWIGTEAGLVRFDGVNFLKWKLPVESPILALLASRDGTLWVATGQGILKLRDQHVTIVKVQRAHYNALLQDAQGDIWTVRSRFRGGASLCQIHGDTVRCFGKSDGIACSNAEDLAQDSRGNFWLGADIGLCRWRPGSGQLFPFGANSFKSLNLINAIIPQKDGSVLVGFKAAGPRLGLEQIKGQTARPFVAPGLDGGSLPVKALYSDREGALWIGTEDQGLYRVANGRVDHFTSADGLSGNDVSSIYEDREGGIWVATIGGVDLFHKRPIIAFGLREGLGADEVPAILAARDGTVWISTNIGLDRLRDGSVTVFSEKNGLPGHSVTSLFEDHDGMIWLGADNNLVKYDGRAFHIVRDGAGAPLGAILQIAEDAAHQMWFVAVGEPYKLYRITATGSVEPVRLPGGAQPHSIATTSDGGVWVDDWASDIFVMKDGKTSLIPGPGQPQILRSMLVNISGSILAPSRRGIYYWHDRHWSVLNMSNGLPCDDTESLTYDVIGALWVRMQCGLLTIAKADLDPWLEHGGENASFQVF